MNTEKETFGILLRFYRERTILRRVGKPLSQEMLANEVGKKTGLHISRNQVGYWENDKSSLHPQKDRFILIAIVDVLFAHGGIRSIEDANLLLDAGKYRGLTPNEADAIHLNPKADPTLVESNSPKPALENPSLSLPLLNTLIAFLSKMPETSLKGDAQALLDHLIAEKFSVKPEETIELYTSDCRNLPINLTQQRLLTSISFGAYFTTLLNQPDIYVDLNLQIDCPALKGHEKLPPLQRIFWLLTCPNGPRTLLIGGEGGMGKSTLAAKIIRCLYHEQAVDVILGDSAKTEYVDLMTQEILQYEPGYHDALSFYKQICNQLGLLYRSKQQMVDAVKTHLAGKKAIIFVDNLETVDDAAEILDTIKQITSRDIRAIITTRYTGGAGTFNNGMLMIQMQPLTDLCAAKEFLLWHLEKYQNQYPALKQLEKEIYQNTNIEWLIQRTGGIPLLMQFVLSYAAKYSWKFAQMLPDLFGSNLLHFLYQRRWHDLTHKHADGDVAQRLVQWVANRQGKNQSITYQTIAQWGAENRVEAQLPGALSLLYERFLIRDTGKNTLSIYPSFGWFIAASNTTEHTHH